MVFPDIQIQLFVTKIHSELTSLGCRCWSTNGKFLGQGPASSWFSKYNYTNVYGKQRRIKKLGGTEKNANDAESTPSLDINFVFVPNI